MILRAPWIVMDVSSEIYGNTLGIIENGALLVSKGLIKAAGKADDIIKEFSGYPIQEHESKVFTPALINSHCHLELSHLDLANHGQDQTIMVISPYGSEICYRFVITFCIMLLMLKFRY
jgi:imidazolonepropionase-like amidohydrolase